MTAFEIAKIYTDLVKAVPMLINWSEAEIGAVPTAIYEKKIKVGAEREIPEEEHQAKEKINALRTKCHELLMAKMREDRIDFSDGIGPGRQMPAEAVLNRWDAVPLRRRS